MQAKATRCRLAVRAYQSVLAALLATTGCSAGRQQASPPDAAAHQEGAGQAGSGALGSGGGPGSGGGIGSGGGLASGGAPGIGGEPGTGGRPSDGGAQGGTGGGGGSDGGQAGGAGNAPTDGGVLVQPQPGVIALPTSGTLAVTDLRANDLKSPLGVDSAAPALSWTLTSDGYNQKQTDYRIEVAGNAADLTAETQLLWDSGRVASDRNADIAYKGKPLIARQRAYWRVRVWNGAIASEWSAPDFWEMGLLSASDWSARWIKRGTSTAGQGSAPMFAEQFQVDAAKQVARARLYISGLGLAYAEVNGSPVSDSYFDPSESDYRRRIFYCTYDVTSLLRPGTNGFGFELGNGMYGNGVSPNGGRYEKSDGLPLSAVGLHGTAKGIAQLEVTYTDGTTTTVATKESWRATDSPITFNTWYGGEDYDARRAAQLAGWSSGSNTFNGWTAAQLVPALELPSGALRARPTPAIRIVETLSGAVVKRGQFASGNGWVDVSHNGAGFEGISFNAALPATPDYAGVALQFYPAEVKTVTDVDQSSTRAGTAPVFDTYTFSGRETAGTKWNPRFVYHGYRYYKLVLILPAGRAPTDYGFANLAAMLGDLMNTKLAFVGHIVRTDNAKTGSFTSSNATFNLLHTNIDRSIASQMYSTHTDCPHIEKLGWMETSHLMFPSIADTYDIRAWMSKIAQDAVDSQVTGTGDSATQSGGSLGGVGYPTAIAPPFQIINGLNMDPNWNGAIILTPWEHYLAYGNLSVLRASYPAMQKYLRWLEARYAQGNYLINDAQMGEWGQYQVATPTPLVVTAAFYRMADAMAQTAALLGDAANATAFASLATKIKASFNTTFFTAATNVYRAGTQASYAIPLFAGLVPDASISKVADQLATVTQGLKYTITTGEVALRQMISALTANGRSDVVYNIALQPAQPGYRYMAETLGETSLTEYWNYVDQWGNTRSRNHDMMGHIQDWFTRGLAGIDRASPGYRDIVIKPYVPNNATQPADARTTSAAATVGSTFGTISSGWQLGTDGSLTMSVIIPVGATATVHIPALGATSNTVSVSYGAVKEQTITGTLANGYVQLKGVPSGQYTFRRAAP